MTPSDLGAYPNIGIMDGRPARYYDEVHADASISVAAPTITSISHVKPNDTYLVLIVF